MGRKLKALRWSITTRPRLSEREEQKPMDSAEKDGLILILSGFAIAVLLGWVATKTSSIVFVAALAVIIIFARAAAKVQTLQNSGSHYQKEREQKSA